MDSNTKCRNVELKTNVEVIFNKERPTLFIISKKEYTHKRNSFENRKMNTKWRSAKKSCNCTSHCCVNDNAARHYGDYTRIHNENINSIETEKLPGTLITPNQNCDEKQIKIDSHALLGTLLRKESSSYAPIIQNLTGFHELCTRRIHFSCVHLFNIIANMRNCIRKVQIPNNSNYSSSFMSWILGIVIICSLCSGGNAGFACLSNPCVFGVCIDGLNSSYSCYCIDGYTGVQCQTNWDECWSSPCINGGTCIDGVAYYNCTCQDGFTGINCGENVDECLSNPCQNGGACRDRDNGYSCTCKPGYLGTHCEVDVAVCDTGTGARCHNGGECIEGPGLEFDCKCAPGWYGKICEEEINECASSPCQNGGICVDKLAVYLCACPMGYTGINCEEEILICANNPCKNNALCLMEEGIPTCYCVPDYHGEKCEFQYDECQLGPKCTNGGVCLDGVDTFSCSCPPLLTGILCECLIASEDNLDCNYTATIATYTTATFTNLSETTSWIPPSYEIGVLSTEHAQVELSTEGFEESSETIYSTIPKDQWESEEATTASSIESEERETTKMSVSGQSTYIPILTVTSRPTWTPRTTVGTTIMYDFTKPYSQSSPDSFSSIFRTTTFRHLIDFQRTTVDSGDYADYTDETTPYDTSTIETKSTIFDLTKTWSDLPQPISTVIPETQPESSISTSLPIGGIDNSDKSDVSSTEKTESKEIEIDVTTHLYSPHEPIITTTYESVMPPYWMTESPYQQTPKFSFKPIEETTKYPFTDDLVVSYRPTTSATTTTTTKKYTTTQTATPAILETHDCIKSGCFNGGTCVTTSEGSRCVCRFDRQGHLCETQILISNAAFSGDSYVSHRIHKNIPDHENLDAVLPIHVQLKVRTRASNGLIMLAAGQGTKGGHYMALFLQKGLLQFQFSCGLQTMLLSELETPVNTGNEITIRTELDFSRNYTHCNASLLVNDTLAMSGDQPTWLKLLPSRMYNADVILNTWLHLGGAPQAPIGLVIELPPAQSGTGFTGCLHSLKINDENRQIFGDALDGFGITECGSLACLSSPCRNGAACIKIDTNDVDGAGKKKEKWKCKCPTGYMGPTCEISVCEDNPCQYGGTCVQFPGSGYLCLCPLGKHGHYCEHNLEVALPSFSGSVNGLSSFVAYTVPIPLEYSLELSFKILPQTMSQISLLAFLGQAGYHDEKSDHLAVSFIQGYIMLTWNLGGGPRRIFTQKPIDFRLDAPRVPYEIKIGRIGRQAWLSVDGKFNITGRSPGSVTRMEVMPILYLGGHEIANFNTLPHDLPLHSGFQGCIYDVNLKAGQITVPLQETRGTRGRGVGQCGTRECHRHACQHDGACLQHGATFTCICQEGWYGPLCAQPTNPCDSFNNKCAGLSTCVPLVNGYECDCPLGKTAKNCDEDIQSLSDVSLTGRRSYLSVKWPYLTSDRNVKLGAKRSEIFAYRNFTKKLLPKPVAYSAAPSQHFVMKLLNEVEKQRNFAPVPFTAKSLDEHHRVQFFFIELQIRPLSERGLLLYFGTLNSNQDRQIGFVSLSLQGGVVEFRISGPNNHVTVVRSVRMLAIGEWHKIKLAQRGRWLTLWVEGSASSALAPSAEVLVEQDSLLFVGGLKDLSKLPYNAISGFPIPFRGCVRGLVVSGTRIILNESNILDSRNIRDCDGTACGGDSCEAGGHCWLDEKLQPHCICPEYAKGDRCEYSETCKLIPCKNNGRCLRGGRCSCPNGWGGFYCEIAMMKPTTPSFRGNSYLVLPPPRIPVKEKRKGSSVYVRPRETIHISLNFSTIETNGLLLWSQHDNSEYLGLGIDAGYMKIVCNLLESSSSYLKTTVPIGDYVADGGWHNSQIVIDNGVVELSLDGKLIFSERTNTSSNLFRRGSNEISITYEDEFLIGGFPNDESVSSKTRNRFHQAFKGCLQDISFSGGQHNSQITDFSPYQGENIGSCNLHGDDYLL